MDIERNLIIALLKMTREGSVSHELVNKEAKIPSRVATELLRKLQNSGLVYVKPAGVEADAMQRLRLAVRAIGLGCGIEQVSSLLQWQEFEGIAAVALEQNGYSVSRNLRFEHSGRRWEIDVVGCKKPLVVCIDCKHWRRGIHLSALKNVVMEQVERTSALAASLPSPLIKIECTKWDVTRFIPIVLSVVEGRFKFYDNVPIVPVLKLQDFLNQLPAYADSLEHFTKRFTDRINSSF